MAKRIASDAYPLDNDRDHARIPSGVKGIKTGRSHEIAQTHSPKPVRWSSPARMLISIFLILATGLALHKHTLISAADQATHDNIVDLGYAKYLGNRTTTWPNTVSYLGLPYAEAPVGDRRFRAPLPLDTERIAKVSNGKVVDARSYPSFCIQGALFPSHLIPLPPSLLRFIYCV
jgi:hypothetical protein